jgi:hypothetical protein
LTVFLTYLSTWFVIKSFIFKEDGLNVLMGVLWVTLIYMFIGLIWGSLSSEKKKFLLPLILYVLVLYGFLIYSMITKEWFVFINGFIPFTYFIRNIGSRDLFVLIIYGSACVLPNLGLYLMFKLSHSLTHRKAKVIID